MNEVIQDENKRNEAFRAGLNRHGYAFQYRLIEEIKRLAAQPHSEILWKPLAVEVPVAISDRSSRIDLVFEMAGDGRRSMIVGEVKRVNPAYGTWCFAKAPFSRPSWLLNQLCFESVVRQSPWGWKSAGVGGPPTERLYAVAFVVKSNKKGDSNPVSSDNDAIEQACGQVLLGMNGLIDMLLTDPRISTYLKSVEVLRLLPVIFTTAALLATDVDLSKSDLSTGEIDLRLEHIREVDWLVYQYPQGPALKHSVERGSLDSDPFENLIARDFVRSVAIVGPSGIADFLRWSSAGFI